MMSMGDEPAGQSKSGREPGESALAPEGEVADPKRQADDAPSRDPLERERNPHRPDSVEGLARGPVERETP